MPAREIQPTFFATTRWTLVCHAAASGDTQAVDALGALFLTYWPPLYRYVRRLGKSTEDAEDLVQGFFAHLLEQNGLRLADRDRGKFRAFLLGSFKKFRSERVAARAPAEARWICQAPLDRLARRRNWPGARAGRPPQPGQAV